MTPVTSFTTNSQSPTVDGDTLFVSPTGVIDTTGDAVYFSSNFTEQTLVNQGDIFGNNALAGFATQYDLLYNYGNINSAGVCVALEGNFNETVNSGFITGGSEALDLDGSSATVSNTGTISGINDGLDCYVSSVGKIDNFGQISGHVHSLSLSGNGSFTIHNAGKLIGDVQLGNGTNTLDNRGGSVVGAIIGGAGIDTVYAGNDGERINGGKGHDKLYAGAGADTFAFTSYSSPDYDHISHFDVAQDTIQLDHTVFTHLAADTTPVFSIASAPKSTTNLLYYNSSTGGLYYDPDGSGTKYHGYAVAVLDKGLHLAASNFSVV